MSGDIVERLRAEAKSGNMPLGRSFDVLVVANEIERLRAEVAGLYADCDAWGVLHKRRMEQIEWLRAAVEVRDEALMVCLRDGDAVRALIADEEARRER